MEDYMNEDLSIMLIGESCFILYKIDFGNITQEIVDLIEDNWDPDDNEERLERQNKCKFLTCKYSENILAVGYFNEEYHDIPEDLVYDHEIITNIALDDIVESNIKKILFIEPKC
jgi:hypothetical protein